MDEVTKHWVMNKIIFRGWKEYQRLVLNTKQKDGIWKDTLVWIRTKKNVVNKEWKFVLNKKYQILSNKDDGFVFYKHELPSFKQKHQGQRLGKEAGFQENHQTLFPLSRKIKYQKLNFKHITEHLNLHKITAIIKTASICTPSVERVKRQNIVPDFQKFIKFRKQRTKPKSKCIHCKKISAFSWIKSGNGKSESILFPVVTKQRIH